MNTNAINTTTEQAEILSNVEVKGAGINKAEICFGVIMAIAALSAMWGAVSLMISFFISH